jgi:hypothetical protein
MLALGALGGLALYAWIKIDEAEILASRTLLVGTVFTGVFFSTALSLSVRMTLIRASMFSAAHAGVLAGLIWGVSWRYGVQDWQLSAHSAGAALVLMTLPLPFFIAAQQGNWRNYEQLFGQSWDIVLRNGIAILFIAAVWLLLYLSDLLLSLVGLQFLDTLLDVEALPYLITGAAGGFALAVASEGAAPKAVGLMLMLLRPLLPLLLAIVALFLAALPFRGLSNLFGGLSAGGAILTMSAVAASLITAVAAARGEDVSRSKAMALSARALAILLLFLSVLAMVSVGLRTVQYGWTPARLYAGLAALIAIGFGAHYAYAALHANWAARIRNANISMALAMIAAAALALTPLFNAERISTASQMARLADGRTAAQDMDIAALGRWGVAGEAAIAVLTEKAKAPGQEALSLRLENPDEAPPEYNTQLEMQRRALAQIIPLQPASAKPVQMALMQSLGDYEVQRITALCNRPVTGFSHPCVMLVAEFLPNYLGDEGMIIALSEDDTLEFYALISGSDGPIWAQTRILGASAAPTGEAARNLMRAWQDAPPSVLPAPINALPLGDVDIVVIP